MPPPDGCSINSAASDESEDTEPLIGSDESEENIFYMLIFTRNIESALKK